MKVHELFEAEERSILSVLGQQPEHVVDFNCEHTNLTSLEGVPPSISGSIFANNNKLTSLHNIHKQIKRLVGYANFFSNPIKSHVLGVLLIDRLQYIWMDNFKVQTIINKHLKGDRDIFACQEELIEAGFEEFAQL